MADGIYQFLTDRRWIFIALLSIGVKDRGTLFHQLSFPVADHGLMDFELGSEFGKLLLTLDRRDGDLELEFFGVVAPLVFSQLQSPSQHQADKLTSLSSPAGPLYNPQHAQCLKSFQALRMLMD